MFDFGNISQSADQLAQAGAGIYKSVEAMVNLQIEQNALLGAIYMRNVGDAMLNTAVMDEIAAGAIQRYLANQARPNG